MKITAMTTMILMTGALANGQPTVAAAERKATVCMDATTHLWTLGCRKDPDARFPDVQRHRRDHRVARTSRLPGAKHSDHPEPWRAGISDTWRPGLCSAL